MRIERHHGRSLRTRAKQLIIRRRFQEAVAILTDVLKYFPNSYKIYRLRSLAYACLHNYAASRSDANMIISLVPDSPEGYYFRGFCFYHEKEYLRAGEAFAEGMKRTPFDRVMKQAFWDAVTLASQTRTNVVASP